MKFKDIKQMNNEQLDDKLLQVKKELIKQNGQVATGTSQKNSGQIREMKKTVAKLLTAKNQKAREKKA